MAIFGDFEIVQWLLKGLQREYKYYGGIFVIAIRYSRFEGIFRLSTLYRIWWINESFDSYLI